MIWSIEHLLFMAPAIVLGLWAQMRLSTTFGKYSRVGLYSGLSGAEAARAILDRAGLVNVPVEEVGGHLSDHYDPTKRTLRLSSGNYHGRSVAAVGVAAHEAGHALQHQAAYAPLQLRMAIVPVTQFASYAWIVLILLGMFFAMSKLVWLGIGVFSIIMFFQLITLPVEFDASKRAKERLLSLGLVQRDESQGVSRVLNAAAWTYVAALVSSVMQLLYLLSVANRNRN
jgi:Zn-dependent membrane protease YugP